MLRSWKGTLILKNGHLLQHTAFKPADTWNMELHGKKPLQSSDRKDRLILVPSFMGDDLGYWPPMGVLPLQGSGRCCSLHLCPPWSCGPCRGQGALWHLFFMLLPLPLQLGWAKRPEHSLEGGGGRREVEERPWAQLQVLFSQGERCMGQLGGVTWSDSSGWGWGTAEGPARAGAASAFYGKW